MKAPGFLLGELVAKQPQNDFLVVLNTLRKVGLGGKARVEG